MLSHLAHIKKDSLVNKARWLRIGLGVAGLVLIVDCGLLLANRVWHIGTIIPFGMGLICLAHALKWRHIQGYLANQPGLKSLWKIVWLLFFVWLLSFLLFVFYLKQHFNTDIKPVKADAIIVLGGGTKDNKPTDAVMARLDKASAVIKDFPKALIITSGGTDAGAEVSEAKSMADYLNQRYGIALSRIKLEAHSTSTELNFVNCAAILSDNHIRLDQPIVAVTSDFHTLRASKIGKKQGYSNLQVVGANTPWYIRPNSWFREYFAFISGWLLNEY